MAKKNGHVLLPSRHAIDEIVDFKPMMRHCERFAMKPEYGHGRIIAIRFTKAKVLYDIVDDYWGRLFRDVDSCNVRPIGKSKSKKKEA